LTTAELALLAVCVLLAALASATETAMTAIGRLRVRRLVEEGSDSAEVLQRLHEDPNRFLSTVLVVNTLALILASFATTLLSITFVPPRFGVLGDLAVSLALSVFLLIFAEVTPKTLAIRNAERLALAAAGPVDLLSRVLRPVLWFITLIAHAVAGSRGARTPYVTEQELITLLQVSEEQGVIEEQEEEMITGIIEIGDKTVREVMVPRTDVTAVPRDCRLQDVVQVFREHRHTRLPVYEGDLDHMVGLVHVKDLLLYFARGMTGFELKDVLRPIQYVPEQKKVAELLHRMQSENAHMMAVMDEYGGTAGIVTLEDVLEEIVGEIRDEYDVAEEEPLRILSPTEAVVDARYSMAELNERLQLGLEKSEDYDSVGGYVYATLGDVPDVGASFDGGRVNWTVEEVSDRRILRVRLRATEPWPEEILVEPLHPTGGR
jgi:CBS domain containing-hemolysin-like protein